MLSRFAAIIYGQVGLGLGRRGETVDVRRGRGRSRRCGRPAVTRYVGYIYTIILFVYKYVCVSNPQRGKVVSHVAANACAGSRAAAAAAAVRPLSGRRRSVGRFVFPRRNRGRVRIRERFSVGRRRIAAVVRAGPAARLKGRLDRERR